MAEKIEKKISRVMRWLDRCALSCRGESYGSALMDIECARVDFDSARDEIWNVAHKRYSPASGKKYFIKFFRTTVAAAVILLSAAAPVSFIENTLSDNSLEWVTPDEKVLLRSLREQLSSANTEWAPLTDAPVETYSSASANGVNMHGDGHSRYPGTYSGAPANDAGKNQKAPRSEATVLAGSDGGQASKNDKIIETQIFTLLKIGENALKGKPSAIMVER